jgi:hypothetical protein
MRRSSLIRWCLAFLPAVLCPQIGAQQTAGSPPESPKVEPAKAPQPPDAQKSETPPDSAKSDPAKTPPAPDAQQSAPPPAAPKATPGKGYEFKVGESTLKLGGYVKVDLIHDFDRVGSTDSFDPRTIDTTGLDGENTRMHAKETRLNLDVRTPTDMGELKTYIEGDFFSSSNGFRMRHAYGQLGPILGGQTWSAFMDEGAMPSTLDFESPIAFPLARVAQVRYTQNFGDDGDYWAVAVEDPNNSIVSPAAAGTVENPAPDVTARIHLKNDRGHVQVGLYSGMAAFQPDVGGVDNAYLWGVNLSTKETTWGDDYAILQLTYGDGVGGFRGGQTAAPDAGGSLEAVRTSAWMAAYQHAWTEKYRSTVTYSYGRGDLPGGVAPDANEALTYLAGNLIWQFTPRAWVGIEYLHGTRDTFDGSDGSADRLQLALKFDL